MDERVLNELLECSVCLDTLELSSKVLPCQHTFCRRCLEEIVSTKHELRCPECRNLVEVPIEDLPPNILLIRLLEGMKHAGRIAASRVSSAGDGGSGGSGGGGGVRVTPIHSAAGAGCHVRAAKCSPKAVSTSQPCATAIYNYDAKEPGDLSFAKGDVVLLRKQVDENWYHGELNGHQGFFPATYVQVITHLPLEIPPKCRALYDFVVKDNNEKDCLNFHRDDELTVIRRVDNNWAEGKLADRIGIFPISFVEMNDAAKWLVNAHFSQSRQKDSSRAAPATCSPLVSTCLTSPVATTAPTFCPSSGTKTVAPPSNPNVLLTLKGSQQKRHSMTALSSSPHHTADQHRHSMEIPSGHEEPAMVTGTTGDGTAVTLAPTTISKVSMAAGVDSKPRTTEDALNYSAVPPTFYTALYNYKPQKLDEVELRKGDYYTVAEKCQDGWYKGTCLRSGCIGVFPGNYLQAAKMSSSSQPGVTMAAAVSSSSADKGVVISVSRTTTTVCKPCHVGRAPAVPPHAVVGRTPPVPPHAVVGRTPALPPHAVVGHTHSFPKTSPRASPSVTTPAQAVPKMPNVTVTHTRTITNVTQAVTRSLMSASQQSRPLTHADDIPDVKTVSHAQVKPSTKHSETPGCGDKNHSRGSGGSRSTEKLTKHSASVSTPISHQQSVAASVPHHSTSSSVVVTPPNVVVGTSNPYSHTVTTATSKDKKERREKDVLRLGLMRRLTAKNKTSPPPYPKTDDSHGHPPVPHQRCGSLPAELKGATAGSSALQHKKSISLDTSHPSSSSSSSSSPRPGKPKPLARERYRCIAPYPPQSDLELELKVGDIIYIHKKREDGWFKGTQQRTGKTGLFPGSFVKGF